VFKREALWMLLAFPVMVAFGLLVALIVPASLSRGRSTQAFAREFTAFLGALALLASAALLIARRGFHWHRKRVAREQLIIGLMGSAVVAVLLWALRLGHAIWFAP
jgi:hypothetical protein